MVKIHILAQKVAAENIIASYLSSFFDGKKSKILICVARAGNVIGGGDWSSDRIIPDCVKSWSKNKIPEIRNPNSTRPWQHVLEAVAGYLVLGSNLFKNKNFMGNHLILVLCPKKLQSDRTFKKYSIKLER